MNASNIAAGSGLILMVVAVLTMIGTVLRNIRKNQEKVGTDLEKRYQDGIAEGLRRAEPQLSELRSELRLMTSERDQARSDLGEWRSDYRKRGNNA